MADIMNITEALADPLLNQVEPRIFEAHNTFDPSKPTALVYAACHGRGLCEYLKTRKEFYTSFNLMRLETGPIILTTRKDIDVFGNEAFRFIFNHADVVITYNTGLRQKMICLERVRKFMRPDVKVITFTAPNCSCFWPIAYGYGSDIGIFQAMQRGQTPEQIWDGFINLHFDPYFDIRWRLELGRLADKDSYHDVKLSAFVVRNHRKAKLWMSTGHPSYVTLAYLGSKVLEIMGFPEHPEQEILKLPNTYDLEAAYPETYYELGHYKFEYPMMTHRPNDLAYYKDIFDVLVKHIQAGGLFGIPGD